MKNFNLKKALKFKKGYSLIEFMIALFIGLIVTAGIIKIFDTSSHMKRTQNGLARIQENGRYALTYMKQEIEQAGYQYCFGESNDGFNSLVLQPPKVAWNIETLPFLSGFNSNPVPFAFDPSFLLRGHECDTNGCTPALNSLGSDLSTTIPLVGTQNGDRIADTDVLTIRHLKGTGREISSVAGDTISFTAWSISNPPNNLPSNGQVLVVDCNVSGAIAPTLLSIRNNGISSMRVSPNPPVGVSNSTLARLFDFQEDFITKTFYVANNIINGRSIPTLYSVENGTVRALVQGVDDFDVIYGVRNNLGEVQFLDAAGVDAISTNCLPDPIVKTGLNAITNMANCGWRSVESIELHLLLNTIYNSSTRVNEQFLYSQYGNNYVDESNIPSTINHYSMHRREFSMTITLKNTLN